MAAYPKALNTALVFGILVMTVAVLVQGRSVLIPIAIAVIFWYLQASLAKTLSGIRIGGRLLPGWLCLTIAVLIVIVGAVLAIELVGTSVAELKKSAPTYEANLKRALGTLSAKVGYEIAPALSKAVSNIGMTDLIIRLAGTVAGFAMNVLVVTVYVIFLMVEAQSFDAKLNRIYPDEKRRGEVSRLLGLIQTQIRRYIGVQFAMGLLAAVITWVTLRLVGVDFAVLWAFIIFLLSFIPTIGTMLGIVFPAAMTLVQFGALKEFLIVVGVLGAAQLAINNWLQPQLASKSLNLSPFAIIVGLSIAGAIWGVVGALICVPIMVIAGIIMSHFPKSLPIAIAMSSDGNPAGVDPD